MQASELSPPAWSYDAATLRVKAKHIVKGTGYPGWDTSYTRTLQLQVKPWYERWAIYVEQDSWRNGQKMPGSSTPLSGGYGLPTILRELKRLGLSDEEAQKLASQMLADAIATIPLPQ